MEFEEDSTESQIVTMERVVHHLMGNLKLLAGTHASANLPKPRDKASFDKLLKARCGERDGSGLFSGVPAVLSFF